MLVISNKGLFRKIRPQSERGSRTYKSYVRTDKEWWIWGSADKLENGGVCFMRTSFIESREGNPAMVFNF